MTDPRWKRGLWRSAVGSLLAVSLVALSPVVASAGSAKLEEAKQLYAQLDLAPAEAALYEALAELGLSEEERAEIHVYLGLVRLNRADFHGAKAAFRTALEQDLDVSLPLLQSPKAALLFQQAQGEVISGVGSSPERVAVRAERGTMSTLAYGAGGLSVAALGAALYFGIAASSDREAAGSEPAASAAGQLVDRAGSEATTANVLYAGAGVLAVTAIVLYVVDGPPAPSQGRRGRTGSAPGVSF